MVPKPKSAIFNKIHLVYVFILKTLVFSVKTFYHIARGYSIPSREDFFKIFSGTPYFFGGIT